MMLVPWRLVVPVVAGALVLAGCDRQEPEPEQSPIGILDDDDVAGEPEPDRDPEPEVEPEPEVDPDPDPDPATDDEPEPDTDPFAVPDEIDKEYTDLVIGYLLSVGSDVLIDTAFREVGSSLSEEGRETLEAIYSGARLEFSLEDYEDFANNQNRRDTVFPPEELGHNRWSTVDVLEAGTDCIVATGYEDFSEISISFEPRQIGVLVSLAPAPETDKNPTGWTIHDITPLTSGGDPIPEETWAESEFWDVLDNTCDR